MLLVWITIPVLAALLACFVDRDDAALRRGLGIAVALALCAALLVLMPRAWLPWPELASLGLGRGRVEEDADLMHAAVYRARWLPTLGVDLAGSLRASDVLIALALALALLGASLGTLEWRASLRVGPERVRGGRARHSGAASPRQGSAGVTARSWDLAARCGLVAAALAALVSSDAGMRAWCVALAFVASAVEHGAGSHGAKRSGWGGDGLMWGIAALAATWAAALQSAAAGHAAFSPPIAADAAARATALAGTVGAAVWGASLLAAVVLFGVFPLRRWTWAAGERDDPRGELLRDVAGWAMGVSILRAGVEAAPGVAAASVNLTLWITAGSLAAVALAWVGCSDGRARRRLFAGLASTVIFALVAVPSRATWSVVGLVVATCTLAALALALGEERAPGLRRPRGPRGDVRQDDPAGDAPAGDARRGSHSGSSEAASTGRFSDEGGWMAAAILVLPFGPGLVAWMVLGRGLSAAPPLGVARLPFDASAVTATWAAATLAAAACLASLLTMTLLAARTAVGQPGDPPLADDGAARRPSAHEPSPSAPPDVVRRQGLALTAVAAVLLPLLGRPLLAAADADAERTFAQWAHRRCADDVAREAGREGRSRLRPGSSEDAAGEARGGAMGGGEVEGREAQICGAAPSRSAQAGGRTAQRGRASRAAFADAVARLTAEVGL